jgi:hypothetical protein
MKTKKALVALTLTLAMSCCAGTSMHAAHAADKPKFPPPPMHGVGGFCADETNLYVVQGGRILKYVREDLSLAATVDLPRPTPPSTSASASSSTTTDATSSSELPPLPPMGGGCWTDGSLLYVITGPLLHAYSVPDLTLGTTVELPRPEPPSASK